MDSEHNTPYQTSAQEEVVQAQAEEPRPPLLAPEIPSAELSVDFTEIAKTVDNEKIQKRVSNLLKLNEENEKLKQELKELGERLEAAERRHAMRNSK